MSRGPWCSRFQSTPPARGATTGFYGRVMGEIDFNPRPPRGGRLLAHIVAACAGNISIHAPREGGDVITTVLLFRASISIHAPREGGDVNPPAGRNSVNGFQSTPPARGATSKIVETDSLYELFQSTPPARGATATMTIDVLAS